MTTEEYKLRAAEFRGHMEDPETFNKSHTALEAKVSAYVPGGEKRSVVPEKPPGSDEDYSHLNAKGWKTCQAQGRKNGGRPKK